MSEQYDTLTEHKENSDFTNVEDVSNRQIQQSDQECEGESSKPKVCEGNSYEQIERPHANEDLHETEKSCDIRIEINDCIEEGVISEETDPSDMTVNRNNPQITISEPVTSPGESEENQTKPPEPKGRCPIYYGIKSYIHDFYQPPDKEVLKSGEYIQEDEFQFLVEPRKQAWSVCWFRTGLWVGVNLILLGVIAMLVGRLTPPRETVVVEDNFTILDRWAVTFNNRLIFCQMAGLAGITSGAIVILVLLVATYQHDQTNAYHVVAATVVPENFVGTSLAGPRHGWGSRRIPLTGSIRSIQPILAPSNH